jgi:hypothetical protein
VVQLFNAVSKAQQARWTSEALGENNSEAIKASKNALLEVLKPKSEGSQRKAPGWKVLQKGFTGFQDATKMKDYDKDESESDDAQDEVQDQEETDDSADVGEW